METKTIWITGASSGIGRATALAYTKAGATVIASARSTEKLEALKGDAKGLKGRIIPLLLDVTDRKGIEKAASGMFRKFGVPDISILNAGTYFKTSGLALNAADVDKIMAVNFQGTVNCLSALLPQLKEKGHGTIAVVSSVAGYVGLPYSSAYGASKAALINLCESLQPELKRAGIDLKLINPGFIKTPLTDKNDFPMPFLMDVDKAAERIVRGLNTKRFEITFPKRFTWLMKLLRMLPYGLRLPLLGKGLRSG